MVAWRSLRSRVSIVAALALVAGLIFGAGAALGWQLAASPRARAASGDPPDIPPAQALGFLGKETIADVVQRVSPAVVHITSTIASDNPFAGDPFFQLFGTRPQQATAIGTGFITGADGVIITNEHVIHNASDVQVSVLNYDKPFPAKVLGYDFQADVAVLKINATGLPTVSLGDSDKVRVGDWVVAIGNPQGLDHTVTVGVLSAKGRDVQTEDNRSFHNLFQTDAAINPGNSGGPLLNLDGQVIAVNNAVKLGAQNIGFAIPINTVQAVVPILQSVGHIPRPYLGVYLKDMDSDSARQLGISQGAIITYVVPNSPADKSGLQQYDVIQQINRQPVTGADQVVTFIKAARVGDSMQLQVWRSGNSVSVTVTIGDQGAGS